MNLARELSELERLEPVLDALPKPAYLVGGTVRDLLLGRPPRFDFDLAVVGDAEAFAGALAERLNGHVTTHGRFGTATVHYGDRAHVDVATARTETYSSPGALPDVAGAETIEEDLGRRDFTINAMAVSLPTGDLIDPHGGLQHLRDQVVRVLHARSFVDDPTRIFRAARYETRLGFRMDPKTETLAMHAASAVRGLSGARIREELVAIFAEEDPERVLSRLEVLGVAGALGFTPPPDGLLDRLRALSAEYRLGLTPAHLGFLALVAPEGWLDELKVQRGIALGAEAAHREAPLLRAQLDEAQSASGIVRVVESFGPDTPLYLLAQHDQPELRAYFDRLRNVRLELDGDDLAALGLGESPRVGEVIAELRRRKLDGELVSRADELAAARELIAE